MSVFYNKKLISGVRDVPQMTLAEYNALTNKPDLWLRTDAPESDRGISASDIEYSTGVSVEDKIDDLSERVVIDVPANTYSKYSQALTAMQTEYNKLTLAEKRRAVLIVAGGMKANVYNIGSGRFGYSVASSNANYIVSFEFDTHKYYVSTIGASSTSFQDNSETAQVNPLTLMII